MLNRILTTVLAVLLLFTGIQSLRLHNTKEALKDTQREVSVLTEGFQWANTAREALEFRLAQTPKLQEKRINAQSKLSVAVHATPDWSSQPVPAAVLDSLRP